MSGGHVSPAVGDEVADRQGKRAVARILVAGDLYLPTLPATGSAHPWLALVDTIADHDVSVVDLECALSLRREAVLKSGPCLVAPPGLAALAREGGFAVASLANNHICDAGAAGVRDTLAACRDAGLSTVGAGGDRPQADAPLIIEAATGRIALLAVAEREFSIAGDTTPGASPLDPWGMAQRIAAARARADIVVVIAHAGNEHARLPRPGLVRACRAMVAAGAHAVVCHHSHVAGVVEVFAGSPIVYGTGNFLFPLESPAPPGWNEGFMASLSLGPGTEGTVDIVPYVQRTGPPRLAALDVEAAAAFRAGTARLSSALADGAALEAAWQRFCEEQRRFALGALLGLTKPERLLFKYGVWPVWRRPRASLKELYNLFTCDSHRELMESLLEREMR